MGSELEVRDVRDGCEIGVFLDHVPSEVLFFYIEWIYSR